MAYNSKINFAILGKYLTKDNTVKKLRIINNWRCKNDIYPTLLISDPESTLEYLKKISEGKKIANDR